jgi:hypothetical protein
MVNKQLLEYSRHYDSSVPSPRRLMTDEIRLVEAGG